MQTPGFVTTLLALSAIALPRPQVTTSAVPLPPPCPNPILREPVVLYEVTGGTLVGAVDTFLTVYNDGTARLSSSLGGAGIGSSQLALLPPALVDSLRQELSASGALVLCDQPDFTSDTPLQTLTVLRPSSRRSNTFSWFAADGDVAQIQAILEAFIALHFVAPPGGGKS
jgi:hypothetical protein